MTYLYKLFNQLLSWVLAEKKCKLCKDKVFTEEDPYDYCELCGRNYRCNNTYKCDWCGKEEEDDYEDALRRLRENHPRVHPDNCDRVCDECYAKYTRMRAGVDVQ